MLDAEEPENGASFPGEFDRFGEKIANNLAEIIGIKADEKGLELLFQLDREVRLICSHSLRL